MFRAAIQRCFTVRFIAMTEDVPSAEALARFRAAASQYSRDARLDVPQLLSVRDDIAALRAKGASIRAISEMLRRCGISVSNTSVFRFCQRVLGEPRRVPKAKPRAAPLKPRGVPEVVPPRSTPVPTPTAHPQPSDAAQVTLLEDLLSFRPEQLAKPPSQGGPRIAKIEFANPEKPDKS